MTQMVRPYACSTITRPAVPVAPVASSANTTVAPVALSRHGSRVLNTGDLLVGMLPDRHLILEFAIRRSFMGWGAQNEDSGCTATGGWCMNWKIMIIK